MTDRKKVIKGLEDSFANQGCGYMDGVGELYAVSGEDLQNAIALLKEQEAVKPERHFARHSTKPYGMEFWYTCGSCGAEIKKNDKFCHECGKEVKWEWLTGRRLSKG